MDGLYILDDDDQPVPVANVIDWAMWRANNQDRLQVDYTVVWSIQISTVFLGIDVNVVRLLLDDPAIPPHLWETMVFSGEPAEYAIKRYASKAEAVAGHADAIEQTKHVANPQCRGRPGGE